MERKQAIALGLTRFNTGRPCRHGHYSDRQAPSGKCLACHSLRETARNKMKPAEVYRNYYEQNAEIIRARSRAWARDNPGRRKANEYARRAQKKQALPTWLTVEQKKEMEQLWQKCPEGHQVDHIVPLSSPVVCGLHVPWNLRIITAEENNSKRSKLLLELAVDYSAPGWHHL